jgi:hypothetical protein
MACELKDKLGADILIYRLRPGAFSPTFVNLVPQFHIAEHVILAGSK